MVARDAHHAMVALEHVLAHVRGDVIVHVKVDAVINVLVVVHHHVHHALANVLDALHVLDAQLNARVVKSHVHQVVTYHVYLDVLLHVKRAAMDA